MGVDLASLAVGGGQCGASYSFREADNLTCQVELSSSLGPFGALRQIWEVLSDIAATSPAGS